MLTGARIGSALAAACMALASPTLGACAPYTSSVATKTVTATAAPTTSTTSQRDALGAWHDAIRIPAQGIHDAMGKIAAAAGAEDLVTMGIACQEAHDAVADFQQHMPSPDPELNAPLQKALSDYSAAVSICTTAVENRNLDDFQQGAALMREANTYMGDALKVLDRDLGRSPDSPGPPTLSSPSVATKAIDPEAASLQELQQLASSDSSFVTEQLANWWVPQLSSKRPGVVDDGIVWDNARTLQEHRQLRQRYPRVRLLWSGDWSTFSAPNFWVTIVGITFPESSGALAWCRNQGLDSDHCAAKIVSTTHPVEGSTAYS
jgi:hypothetical protein